jgi:hypothetical protein
VAFYLQNVDGIVGEARTLLQDTVAPYRYSDADLVTELNVAIYEARRIRPDLFLQYRGKNPYPGFTETDMHVPVPFEDVYRPALVYYIVGKCTLRDEEDTDDKRGLGMIQKFTAQLISLPG